ncbi:proteasome assembly chaperone family protein [Tessaracoccus massiliensis]|uniref:proteasome assembly chaperone family protein n=1 Tax=Tessaracoccus massiliensis TaxID=1522311 RepID=UPI00058C0BAE|nr:PAC2 family protein [Tessaracoccus massiliensis]
MQFAPMDGLRDPAVVIAFSGWNDAGNAASDLLRHLMDSYPGTDAGILDDERYWDFQQTRPMLHRTADGTFVEWPALRLRAVHHPDRDIIVVMGPEPNLLWRQFSMELVDKIKKIDPELVIFVGAMLSDTPHSRPLPVGVHTNDPAVERRYNVSSSDYTGPTGMIGVASQLLLHERIPAASVWVSVPHYVSSPPNPKAQDALLTELETLLHVQLHHAELPQDAEKWTAAVDQLSQQDPDIAEYIGQLEEARDTEEVEEATGDTIAAELEKFLRRRRDEGPSSAQ